MKSGIFVKYLCSAVTAAVTLLMVSCRDKTPNGPDPDELNVLLFYECGFNSLYSYLYSDVNNELNQGYIPTKNDNGVLLVYSKLARNSAYAPVESYLRRVYKNSKGKIISDTLHVFDNSTVATSPQTMSKVLDMVRQQFPLANSYGMVFSSHGSGWLPNGYYASPTQWENNHKNRESGIKVQEFSVPRSEGIPEDVEDPYKDMVRSMGQDCLDSGNIEMSISEFASGIPFHLDYLLFDMCFSAGAEVFYGLKDKADFISGAPTEVLADGMFDYTKITSFLLRKENYDLVALMQDSYNRYNVQSGDYQSYTGTLVRTDGLEPLSDVCKSLFDKYRMPVQMAPTDRIQGYFRLGRHYFYDLYDTFVKCGASSDDLASLKNAIDNCIMYKAHTTSFLGISIKDDSFSGISIYLPAAGTPNLDNEYLKETWNSKVRLVQAD